MLQDKPEFYSQHYRALTDDETKYLRSKLRKQGYKTRSTQAPWFKTDCDPISVEEAADIYGIAGFRSVAR